MDDKELYLSMVYTGAFEDPRNWTKEGHLAGLQAVWLAGSEAGVKLERNG